MAKNIRIPKVESHHLIEVLINRTGIVDTGKALKLTTKKQVIAGLEIPAGHQFWTPSCVITNEFSSSPVAHVPGHVINDMLRFLVIKKLRDNG